LLPINSVMKNLILFFLFFLISYSDCIANTNNPEGDLFPNKLIEIAGYILIFILGCISVIMYFNFRIKKILAQEYHKYKRDIRDKRENGEKYPRSIFGIIQFLKVQKDKYKNDSTSPKSSSSSSSSSLKNQSPNHFLIVEELEKINKNLSDRYSELEKKYLELEGEFQKFVPVSDNIIIEGTGNANNPEKKPTILYFSLPEEDGSFLEDKASVTASARSYYKIEFLEGDRAAKLVYRSGNLDISALSQMDYILGPVCEIENSSMNNPTKIIIDSQGTVIKEEDKWKIKDKIKLKLI